MEIVGKVETTETTAAKVDTKKNEGERVKVLYKRSPIIKKGPRQHELCGGYNSWLNKIKIVHICILEKQLKCICV